MISWYSCHTETEIKKTPKVVVQPYLPLFWDQALLMTSRTLVCEITGATGAGAFVPAYQGIAHRTRVFIAATMD